MDGFYFLRYERPGRKETINLDTNSLDYPNRNSLPLERDCRASLPD
ncbi:hypothetical protein DSUL_50290 [Desulfovibrionales bacterium]